MSEENKLPSNNPELADQLLADTGDKRPIDDETPGASTSLAERQNQLKELRLSDHRTDLQLKKCIGYGALWMMGFQLLVTDGIFGSYIIVSMSGFHTVPPAAVIIAWFSSTVVQIIGVVLIVAKYLFPSSGNNWNSEPKNRE